MIIIIDYGMGNLGSVANMISRIGYKSIITSDINEIRTADKIILPGVGHFDRAMINIRNLGLEEIIQYKVLNTNTPILGICLGMQILCLASEEGNERGLGLINANVIKFRFNESDKLKIPHMGWNLISKVKQHLLFSDLSEDVRFYFVHSYHIVCNNADDIVTTTNYGYDFVSSFADKNILGVQFHPEKSHKYGLNLLKNFIEKI
jgi:imidazole glycerol-phosphate synthase subunit HisH